MVHLRSAWPKCRFTFVGALALLTTAGFVPNAAAVPVYGFALDYKTTLTVAGATVVPLSTSTRDYAGLVQGAGSGFVDHTAPLDAMQAEVGPADPPPENDFAPSVPNIGLGRSDVLIAPFGQTSRNSVLASSVAETNLTFTGAGASSAEDVIDFRVVQTGATPISFSLEARPSIDVSTTAAGDSSLARVEVALAVFDPTGAQKALWLPCGATGAAANNNCNQAGNGLTIAPAFAGTVTAVTDPFSLNTKESCTGPNCAASYAPGLGTFVLTANVGAGSNIFVELDVFAADLVSGEDVIPPQFVNVFDDVDEPSGLIPLAFGLAGLGMVVFRRVPGRVE